MLVSLSGAIEDGALVVDLIWFGFCFGLNEVGWAIWSLVQ